MADGIVAGLFGLSPEQVQQQQYLQAQKSAAEQAQMDPFARAGMMMGQAGAGLTNIVAPQLGLQNPAVEEAKTRQEALQGLDLSSPDSIRSAGEQARQRGDYQLAAQLGQLANQREVEQSKVAYETAQTSKAMAEAEAKNREEKTKKIGVFAQSLIDSGLQPGTPEYQKKMADYIRKETYIKPETGGDTNHPVKPKGLTREAGLKWELDNGLITQQVYDNAMAASAGGKLATEQTQTAAAQGATVDAIQRNLDQLYDPKTGAVTPAANRLFGKFAQLAPGAILPQTSVDANAALLALKDQVMLGNLAAAKAQVGQSFGSMQAGEWDKFTNQLATLDRSQSPESAAAALKFISNFIRNKRKVLDVALKAGNSAQKSNVSVSNW